jgi:hypothetical protein
MADVVSAFPAPKLVKEPPRCFYLARWGELKKRRDLYYPKWEELGDYVIPHIGLKPQGETSPSARGPDRGRRKPLVINNKATMASRTLVNGLASGLTSPSRPWLKFSMPEGTEVDYASKKWMHGAAKAVLWLFGVTNYYTATKMQYRDLAVYGLGTKIMDEHPIHHMNCIPAVMGTYAIALGEDGRPSTIYRELVYTVEQLVERFGLSKCSKQVQDYYNRGNYYKEINVFHVIEPNRLFQNDRKIGPKGMRFASVYFESRVGEDENQLLGYKGYRNKPFSAARWDYLADDAYGSSAAMETLGDVKALQVLEHRKAQAVDKQVAPPTQGPPSLMNQRVNHMPGGYTAVSEVNHKITSLYDVRPDLLAVSQEIKRHEDRIDEAFFVDVMRSATDLTRQNVKAEEILERREEKMMLLAPMLENLYTEMLDIDVHRGLDIGINIGLIPPPPPSLRGKDYQIEYTSTLAQAQKAVAIGSVERLFTFAGGLVGAYPEAKDVLDADAAIAEYGEAIGAPPSLIVPENVVKAARQKRMDQAQQAQAMAMTKESVDAAKNMSQAQMTDPSLLNYLVSGGQ